MSAPTRPRWTLTEAAQRVQVSRSTLRRRLEAGAFPGAVQDDSGAWTVGVEDLLAAGFTLSRPVVDDPGASTLTTTPTGSPSERAHPSVDQAHEHAHHDDDLARRVAELERDLERERAQRELERAQRLAAEREVVRLDANLGDLRQALRMLEAGPRPSTPPPAPERDADRLQVEHLGDVDPAGPNLAGATPGEDATDLVDVIDLDREVATVGGRRLTNADAERLADALEAAPPVAQTPAAPVVDPAPATRPRGRLRAWLRDRL